MLTHTHKSQMEREREREREEGRRESGKNKKKYKCIESGNLFQISEIEIGRLYIERERRRPEM